MRLSYEAQEQIRVGRQQLIQAMASLRKKGFVARANFSCCSSCAGYELAQMVEDMPEDKRAKVKGCVFWHHQDEESIWESGGVFLAYGPLDTTEHGAVGLTTEEVGKAVVEELAKFGLATEWDGDGGTRIWVDLKA